MIATSFIIAQPPIARRRVGNLRPSTAHPRAGNLHRSTGATIRSPVRFDTSLDKSLNKTLHQTRSVATISRSQYQHAAPASDPLDSLPPYQHAAPTSDLANLTHEYQHAARASAQLRNQQYSIIALTDSAGSIVERYTYTPYGAPTFLDASGTPLPPPASSLDNRITYTGREWDSTLHLHHFRARMMDPQLGRFCSKDPMRYFDGFNMYQVGDGKAPIALDPYGLFTYGPIDLLRCYRKLQNRTYGFLAGYDCAAALLDKFLKVTPSANPFSNCPPQCANEPIDKELPPKTCIWLSAGNGGKCGSTTPHVFSMSGSHRFQRGDLHYAFNNVTWTGWADCSVTCGNANACIECCGCRTRCKGRVTVFDTYDFCSTASGGKFSLSNCGCAMERAGWGTKFKVACSKPFDRSYHTVYCPGVARPGPYNCGSSKSNDVLPPGLPPPPVK